MMVNRVARRFRGFLPVVVDVETGGCNPGTDALLELAMSIPLPDGEGVWCPGSVVSVQVIPFPGGNVEPAALAVNGIDPSDPGRCAVSEREALQAVFDPVRQALKANGCTRAVLVGHNAAFDLAFVYAAAGRNSLKRNPFHPFTAFDTATLGGIATGQTVLAKAVSASRLSWDDARAHSAAYDAERTAALFCSVVNRWDEGPGYRDFRCPEGGGGHR